MNTSKRLAPLLLSFLLITVVGVKGLKSVKNDMQSSKALSM